MKPEVVTGNRVLHENKTGAEKNPETVRDTKRRVADESPPKKIGRKIKNIFSI
jgi:hypothetical protein